MALTLRLTSATPSCSEHDLVVAARRGDDRAFEELYSRYRGRITTYISGLVGDHGRAEDIAQEVFISALRRMRDTERPIALKPWIYKIAKNACIDEYRRTTRAKEVPLEADDDLASNDRARLASPLTPDAVVENKQRLAHLRGAFGGLSETHHKLLVMRELEGLSYDEIGTRMGMSRPMVESTLFRARRKLTEEYEELVSGRRCEQVEMAIDALGVRSLRSFGVRERRQLARHLAHCQPCRRMAKMAGFDESIFKPRSIAEKIAALLPFPFLRWRRGGGDDDAVSGSGSHLPVLKSLQNVARFADNAAYSAGFGRAAAAAAAVALAGVGGGLVTGLGGHASTPPGASATAARAGVAGGGQSAHARAASPGRGASSTGANAGSGSRSIVTGGQRLGSSSSGVAPGAGVKGGADSVPTTSAQTGGSTGTGTTTSSKVGSLPATHAGVGSTLSTLAGRRHSILPTQPSGGGTPTLPTATVPKVTLPKVTLPPVTLPKVTLPPVTVPKVTLPPVTVPKVTVPPVTVPKVTVPKVTVPKVTVPKVTLPPVKLPGGLSGSQAPLPKVQLPSP